MITVNKYKGQKVAVFGLGVSGLSAARSLQAGGADVIVWDDAETRQVAAAAEGLSVQNLANMDFKEFAALVLSPGVPLTHPEPHPLAVMANAADCPIIGDIELFVTSEEAAKGRSIIAITGTNGKSTTTALTGHIIAGAGRDLSIAGNIGKPILDGRAIGPGGVYVIEMSSYQIDLTPSMDADVTVLLNITPDHLDRHGGMDGYAAVKAKLAQQQSAGKVAVISVDDSHCQKIVDELKHDDTLHVTSVSIDGAAADLEVNDGKLIDNRDQGAQIVADLKEISKLPGVHNWQNIAMAYAATKAVGISDADIISGIKSFHGLEHRMELVAQFASVDVINDSKATNMDAAARALACYSNIYWIAGGRAKGEPFDAVREYFGNVKKAYLYGEAGPAFGASLKDSIPCEIEETLEVATKNALRDSLRAAETTEDDLVVMLSPACASFDQFQNFEVRGEAFKDYVMDFAAGDER